MTEMISTKENYTSGRILWLDVAKAIGIFMIYLGHFSTASETAYEYVFMFHVPFFFFLSGCAENFNKDHSIKGNLLKIFKGIYIPMIFFAIISLIFHAIDTNMNYITLAEQLYAITKGLIRNQYFARSLWFLSALLVIKVAFIFFKKTNSKILLVSIALASYYAAEYLLPQRPIVQPTYIYNVDSALYYFNFFIIGYLSYPLIERLFNNKKYIYSVFTILFIYGALLFFGKDLLSYITVFKNTFFSTISIGLIRVYLLIFLFLLFAYFLKDCKILTEIGKNTLFLCGSEYLVKLGFSVLLGVFGLSTNLSSPLVSYVYTALLILVANNILVPQEKKLLTKIYLALEQIVNLINPKL